MKNIGSVLVAAAMVVGSFAAIGCNKSHDAIADQGNDQGQASAVAPEESPDTAGVSETAAKEEKEGAPGVEHDFYGTNFYARFAPPALRVETPGVAPSARHFWAPGYWRWSGNNYNWVGGRWNLRREGYAYYGPRWYNTRGRWQYRPGRWYRHY
jgi:hypothetical protein